MKNFLTYNQQLKHLRDNKKISCGGTKDKEYLCRCGFFNLVNGYKTPFIAAFNPITNCNIYFKGTTLEQIHKVKEFDDDLRMLLFKYIVKAEEEVRSFASYKFEQVNNNGQTRWYEVKAYSSSANINDVIKSISDGYKELRNSGIICIALFGQVPNDTNLDLL